MREASLSAARFQPLSIEDGATRRAAKGKGRRSIFARVFGAKRLGATLIFGIAGLAAIGVPMNALFFQDGRHPAPLFATQISLPAKTETPMPPTRPAMIEAARAEFDSAASEMLRPAAKNPAAGKTDKTDAGKIDAARTEAPRAAEKKRDPIGQLLAGGAPQAEKPDNNVLYAQRALMKLGYVVRPDGIFGDGTRQALEKFERDNGLPIKGELTQKLLRQLGTRSGLARQ